MADNADLTAGERRRRADAEAAADRTMRDHQSSIARRRRRVELARARLIAEMASRIAAGYCANGVTSGETDRVSRWSVDIAKRIWCESGLDALVEMNESDPLELER